MLSPEQKAQQALNEWVDTCRKSNSSHKVELKDVSNWVEKRFELDPHCPGLDTVDGVFLLFCFGSLLSFGGGNYRARSTEIREKYPGLLSRKFDVDRRGKPFSDERKRRFEAIDAVLWNLVRKYGKSNFLQSWWQRKKEAFDGNTDLAAESILHEINGFWYQNKSGCRRSLFTVKVFWITRELHSNDIWTDFPVKYCCIPDSVVKRVMFRLYGSQKYFELFGIRHSNPSFNIRAAILMSRRIYSLVSSERVDGFFPYDHPLFNYGILLRKRG